jgi:hypothetical protein
MARHLRNSFAQGCIGFRSGYASSRAGQQLAGDPEWHRVLDWLDRRPTP